MFWFFSSFWFLNALAFFAYNFGGGVASPPRCYFGPCAHAVSGSASAIEWAWAPCRARRDWDSVTDGAECDLPAILHVVGRGSADIPGFSAQGWALGLLDDWDGVRAWARAVGLSS